MNASRRNFLKRLPFFAAAPILIPESCRDEIQKRSDEIQNGPNPPKPLSWDDLRV